VLLWQWNITSYALMTYIVAELVNNNKDYKGMKLIPTKLIMTFGDIHLYEQHYEAAKLQLARIPHEFPSISFNKKITEINDIMRLQWTDVTIHNYVSHSNDFV
jgi:thymidylate synthase